VPHVAKLYRGAVLDKIRTPQPLRSRHHYYIRSSLIRQPLRGRPGAGTVRRTVTKCLTMSVLRRQTGGCAIAACLGILFWSIPIW